MSEHEHDASCSFGNPQCPAFGEAAERERQQQRRRALPWRVRFWLWRHRNHGEPHINTTISVPSFDPSARGILTTCHCGAVGAW